MTNHKHPDTLDFADLEDPSLLEPAIDMADDKITPEITKHDPADSPTLQTVPCRRCNGSGRWVGGYANHVVRECRACGGTGRHAPYNRAPLDQSLKGRERRAKARVKRNGRKREDRNAAAKIHNDWVLNDELGKFLVAAAVWSKFAANLVQAHLKYGDLTEKQQAAARSMQEKVEARGEREADADLSSGNLDQIFKIFTKAIESGLKRPALRIDDIKVSLAPAGGKNAGHLYVKLDDDYQGKIDPDGKWFAIRDADATIGERLEEIAADPLAAAVFHGKRTGNCACCGRELTDPKSVERGIGPICADKWGL